MNGVVHSMKSFSHQKIGTRFIVFDNLVKLFLFLGPICVFASSSGGDQIRLCSCFGFRCRKEYQFCVETKYLCWNLFVVAKKRDDFLKFREFFFSVVLLLISRSSSWSVEVEIPFPFVFLAFRCWFLKRKKLCWS
jgi:hypothetical protein